MKTVLIYLLLAMMFGLVTMLSGCKQVDSPDVVVTAEAITDEDECHVCGMMISRFPGPKGQAVLRHANTPLKFCSTADLFSWLLQPDTQGILSSAYVHDMGKAISWEKPSEEHYVDVKKAWYVIGHNKKGAMGATLASFAEKNAAEEFIYNSGGKLLNYNDIDLIVLTNLVQH